MSKYQIPYNNAKKKYKMAEIPALQKQIADLKNLLSQTGNADEKKAIKANIDALNIKITSFRRSDPVKDESVIDDLEKIEEDGEGAISTANIGSPTITTNDGETKSAPFGNSAYYAPKTFPMVSRRGEIKPNKKKKKIREFIEFYNQD